MPTLLQRRAMERLFKKGQAPDLTTAQGRIALRRARQAEEGDAWAAWAAGRVAAAEARALKRAAYLERAALAGPRK